MSTARDRFLTAARAEAGMPIGAGHAAAGTPSQSDVAAFDAGTVAARAKFLAAARAEDGMPIAAGSVTPPGTVPAEGDRPLVPSRGDIWLLPRRARVAFAARCARRVLPLYRHFWPQAPARHVWALDLAVKMAEGSEYAAATYAAVRTAAGDARGAAAHAADAAHAAARAARADDDAAAYAAAAAAWRALAEAVTGRTIHTLTAPARDLSKLLRVAKERNWTDDTPVPPEAFGPMWDAEPPPWWVEDVTAGLEPDDTSGDPADGADTEKRHHRGSEDKAVVR